jgi:hypothetical protein
MMESSRGNCGGAPAQDQRFDMIQIVYASRPFGFDTSVLISLLFQARKFNEANGITGALLCRDDIYLQLIEGNEQTVSALVDRISRDDRHVEMVELVRRPIQARMFPGWAMRDDPFETWMWSREQIEAGAIQSATAQEALAIFTRIAAKPRLVS